MYRNNAVSLTFGALSPLTCSLEMFSTLSIKRLCSRSIHVRAALDSRRIGTSNGQRLPVMLVFSSSACGTVYFPHGPFVSALKYEYCSKQYFGRVLFASCSIRFATEPFKCSQASLSLLRIHTRFGEPAIHSNSAESTVPYHVGAVTVEYGTVARTKRRFERCEGCSWRQNDANVTSGRTYSAMRCTGLFVCPTSITSACVLGRTLVQMEARQVRGCPRLVETRVLGSSLPPRKR
mmetsp:Transcript_16917/g.36741  ORF Transcript_16917/g.36741 Transcript_16917/m.36741 type:complete len:235 (-) Transcript_16917:507-1211(-)